METPPALQVLEVFGMGCAKLGKTCTDEFSCGIDHHFHFLISHREGGEHLHWFFPGLKLSPGERLGTKQTLSMRPRECSESCEPL